jgi:hypothetical protein
MRRCLTALLVVGLVSVNSRDAAAQVSIKDIAAYAALNATPIGALTPIMVSPGTKGEKAYNSFSGRLSHFSPSGGGDGSNQFGATFYHQAGMNAAVSGTLGFVSPSCTGCDGITMLGGDVHSTLWNNAAAKSSTAMSVNVQGSLGYGHMKNGSALSFAGSVPLAMSIEQASKSRIGLFLTPGYGWGKLSASSSVGGGSESGTRPLLGAGASWTAPAGWGLHLSYQAVVIENGGNNVGLGFSWKMN